LCKCHNVPAPNTTINKKREKWFVGRVMVWKLFGANGLS
jgi:hypothetical protein